MTEIKLETELKRYCGKCGKPLNCKKIFESFNIITGEKEYDLEWRCPDNKSWFSLHTRFDSDRNGDTYSHEI